MQYSGLGTEGQERDVRGRLRKRLGLAELKTENAEGKTR